MYVRSEVGLPVDIIEEVLDHLLSDKFTLAACTLVCRTWMVPSRHRLFATIELSFKTPLSVLESFVQSSESIARIVQTLRIRIDEGWINLNLPNLPSFPSLQGLHLVQVNWEILSTEARFIISGYLPKIKELIMYQLKFRCFEDLQHFISSASHLNCLKLSLDEGYFLASEPDIIYPDKVQIRPIGPPPACPSIHHMSLDLKPQDWHDWFMSWVFGATPVRQLALDGPWLWCSPSLVNYFSIFGPTLQNLSIVLEEGEGKRRNSPRTPSLTCRDQMFLPFFRCIACTLSPVLKG